MGLTSDREVHELLLIEEADAWFEYADATKDQSGTRYAEIEPWAWARLQQRLRHRARRGGRGWLPAERGGLKPPATLASLAGNADAFRFQSKPRARSMRGSARYL